MDPWPNTSGFDTEYEEHEPVELVVKGEIPYYAAGVLYRTGRVLLRRQYLETR
jgi:torulene dioxygenase